jgi:hypothetical protein
MRVIFTPRDEQLSHIFKIKYLATFYRVFSQGGHGARAAVIKNGK